MRYQIVVRYVKKIPLFGDGVPSGRGKIRQAALFIKILRMVVFIWYNLFQVKIGAPEKGKKW